jgi:peptidoglycan hydrolase CwlO-like protein
MRILGSTLGVAAAVILTAGTVLPSGETRAGDVASLDQRLAGAEARLERLRARSDEATDELTAAKERLAEIGAAMDAASSEIEHLAGRARRLDKRFAQLARQLYIGGGVQPLESLLSARSVADMEKRIQYLSGSQHAHLSLVRAMRRERAELNAYLDDLDSSRAETEEIRTRALAVSHDLDRDVEAQRQAVAALQEELST